MAKDDLNIPKGIVFPISTKFLSEIQLFLFSEHKTKKDVVLHLRKCKNLWDYTSEKDIAVIKSRLDTGKNWVSFPLNINVEPNLFYFIFLEPQNGLYWFLSPEEPPVGTIRIFKRFNKFYPSAGQGKRKIFIIKILPEQYPYQGENIINGVNHPEKWTNIWISNPNANLPQWVEFSFEKEMTFNTVHLTFDTNLNRSRESMPPFWKSPTCIKDYKLQIKKNGKWIDILDVSDNYQRHRKHKFPVVKSNKLRILINSTWGAPFASIYEVRIYNE